MTVTNVQELDALVLRGSRRRSSGSPVHSQQGDENLPGRALAAADARIPLAKMAARETAWA
jgi:acetaldehyde dehydrogenase/alcohol dehydrogenase